jgi:hypothetical protein
MLTQNSKLKTQNSPAALVVFAALVLSVATAAGAGERLQVLPYYGFEGRGKIGCWTPVTVEIRFSPAAPSEILDGEIRLYTWSMGQPRKLFHYARPFSMGAGRKSITICAVAAPGLGPRGQSAMDVAIYDRRLGKEVARQPVAASALDEEHLFVVTLGEERLGIGEALAARPAQAERLEMMLRERKLQVETAVLPLEVAPDCWIAYQAVNVLVWDAPRPEALRPAQLQAIRDWVLQGGRLVLTFPDKGEVPDLKLIEDLLPARIAGRVAMALDPASTESGGQPCLDRKSVV